MERIRDTKNTGITGAGLRTWGMLFLAAGVVGKSILQNRLLHLGAVTPQQLLEAMQGSDAVMLYATLALVLQALETCAVPIFAFLLAEGAQHTGSFRNYCLRVTGLAVISEIPYNLAMSGKLLDWSSRNPALGLVFCLLILYFYRRFPGKNASHLLLRGLVTIAAFVWCSMLSIQYGSGMIVIFVVLWAFRAKPMVRSVAGASAAMLCCLFSMFFMASPMGFLAIHFYNGEKGAQNALVNYLTYPVLLLAIALIGVFLV